MAAMVPVREYFDRISAGLACSSLKAAGIHAVVLGDDMGGMRPDLGIIGRVRVLVPETQHEEATALLDEMERQRPQLVDFPSDQEEDEDEDEDEKLGQHETSPRNRSIRKMGTGLVLGIVLILIGIVIANVLVGS